MGTQGESFVKKTQKGLSILAFETTKQSRILKKRMRTAALQKEVKADLRDLGNLVYNALINGHDGILEEEETKILVENIRDNKDEVEHLRDAMARLNRTRKHFEEEAFCFEAPAEPADTPPAEAAPQEQPVEAEVQPATDDAEPLLEPEKKKQPAKPKTKRAPRKTTARKPAEPKEAEVADSPSAPETKSDTGEA